MVQLTRDQAEVAAQVLNKSAEADIKYHASEMYSADGWKVIAANTAIIGSCEIVEFENLPIERYKGVLLYLDTQEGYHAQVGNECFGYSSDIENSQRGY